MQRPQTPTLCNASCFCNPARTSLVLGDSSNPVARYVHGVKRGSARLAGERVHSSKTLQGEEGGQGGQLHNAHCKPMQPDQQQICEYNMCGNIAVMRGRACSGSCAGSARVEEVTREETHANATRRGDCSPACAPARQPPGRRGGEVHHAPVIVNQIPNGCTQCAHWWTSGTAACGVGRRSRSARGRAPWAWGSSVQEGREEPRRWRKTHVFQFPRDWRGCSRVNTRGANRL